jgi:hypothetical protein
LGLSFPLIACINIAYQVIPNVVTNMELKKMSKLGQFTVKVLIYSIEAFLKLFFCEFANRIVGRIVVNIG